MSWIAVDDRYEIGVVEGKVAARSATGRSAGRVLKALPSALRSHPEVDRLRRLLAWLERHEASCLERVDGWMTSGVPVPTVLLASVWPDDAWARVLRDVVVTGGSVEETGFLRGASEDHLLVVTLDGETIRLTAQTVTLPHPVLIPDLAELREFAAELGVTQRIEQIYRAIWSRASDTGPQADAVSDYAGASYPTWSGLAARATSLGYKVTGGYATCRIREQSTVITATVWIGEPYDVWSSTETGALTWQDADGRALRLVDVGPIAWSEGMRMAAALHAGRSLEEKN